MNSLTNIGMKFDHRSGYHIELTVMELTTSDNIALLYSRLASPGWTFLESCQDIGALSVHTILRYVIRYGLPRTLNHHHQGSKSSNLTYVSHGSWLLWLLQHVSVSHNRGYYYILPPTLIVAQSVSKLSMVRANNHIPAEGGSSHLLASGLSTFK